jgi:plastocyanin domain-containing protein
MAKKRRKIDKIRAKNRLISAKKNKTDKKGVADGKNKVVNQKNSNQKSSKNSLADDSQFIVQDLKKTLIITLFVLVVLAFIALRYT